MSTTSILLLVFFAMGASFIQRVTGFGFGIFIMTVLPLIMPSYGEATALSGLLALAMMIPPGINMIKLVKWKKMMLLLVGFIFFSVIAINVVARVDGHTLKKVLGGLLIAISIYFFFISEKIHIKPTAGIQLLLGSLSGIMGGLFAMHSPPSTIYFLASTDDKNEYLALSAWFSIIGNTCMSIIRASNGFITGTVAKCWTMAIPAVVVGLIIGAKVFDKIPTKILKKIVYAFLAVSGVMAIVL